METGRAKLNSARKKVGNTFHGRGNGSTEKSEIGFPNKGNTCYMNSVLQCLIKLEALAGLQHDPPSQHEQLARAFGRLINASELDVHHCINRFAEAVRQRREDFCNGDQNDAFEFFLFLVEELDKEVLEDVNCFKGRLRRVMACEKCGKLDSEQDEDLRSLSISIDQFKMAVWVLHPEEEAELRLKMINRSCFGDLQKKLGLPEGTWFFYALKNEYGEIHLKELRKLVVVDEYENIRLYALDPSQFNEDNLVLVIHEFSEERFVSVEKIPHSKVELTEKIDEEALRRSFRKCFPISAKTELRDQWKINVIRKNIDVWIHRVVWQSGESFVSDKEIEMKKVVLEDYIQSFVFGDATVSMLQQCGADCDSMVQVDRCKLVELPDVLVIHLQRFSFNGARYLKIDKAVDIPIQLDMSRYVGESPGSCSYEFIGQVNHSGSFRFGHYTAIARRNGEKNFYHFDDSCVRPIGEAERDSYNQNAYMLFYVRRKEKASDEKIGRERKVQNGDDEGNEDGRKSSKRKAVGGGDVDKDASSVEKKTKASESHGGIEVAGDVLAMSQAVEKGSANTDVDERNSQKNGGLNFTRQGHANGNDGFEKKKTENSEFSLGCGSYCQDKLDFNVGAKDAKTGNAHLDRSSYQEAGDYIDKSTNGADEAGVRHERDKVGKIFDTNTSGKRKPEEHNSTRSGSHCIPSAAEQQHVAARPKVVASGVRQPREDVHQSSGDSAPIHGVPNPQFEYNTGFSGTEGGDDTRINMNRVGNELDDDWTEVTNRNRRKNITSSTIRSQNSTSSRQSLPGTRTMVDSQNTENLTEQFKNMSLYTNGTLTHKRDTNGYNSKQYTLVHLQNDQKQTFDHRVLKWNKFKSAIEESMRRYKSQVTSRFRSHESSLRTWKLPEWYQEIYQKYMREGKEFTKNLVYCDNEKSLKKLADDQSLQIRKMKIETLEIRRKTCDPALKYALDNIAMFIEFDEQDLNLLIDSVKMFLDDL